MGEQNIKYELEGEHLRFFVKCLLKDLRVLERMIHEGMIESDVKRIGAEQELFLVDQTWKPSPRALEVLEKVNDHHFITEIGLFNLEINLDPLVFGGKCFSHLEKDLTGLLGKARQVTDQMGIHLLLTGILPTIRKSDLGMENLTPMPRYYALNHALTKLRGGDYDFYIRGLDELSLKHDSLMVEACNTSFQVHLQVSPDEFARMYNIAQVVTAPALAASTNSPLLFGRRLWHETRIAVFQQAVDTRMTSHYLRERSPRVTFGTRWVKKSILELYYEDVARFRSLIGSDVEEDANQLLKEGKIPQLKALKFHNSTVYRWNRACFGQLEDKPHLRIENRVLPSGPTPLDEVANAAFWLGLMRGVANKYEDITRCISFEDAKRNFFSAARMGLFAQFTWFDAMTIPVQRLICDQLLPLAHEGLQNSGIHQPDIDRYLGVIEERVRTGMTGSQWILTSLAEMKGKATPGERLNALTAAMINQQQKEDHPVAQWEPARLEEAGGARQNFLKVEQYMTTDLYTVQEDEPLELAANLMDWMKIRHVPVEDRNNRLVGLVSYRTLLRLMARGWPLEDSQSIAISEIMKKTLITVSPETLTLDAIQLMRQNKISCLPVVKEGRLVGIVTERDFMNVTAGLLEDMLKGNDH